MVATPALIAMFWFYGNLYRIAARELGHRTAAFWLSWSRELMDARVEILVRIVQPSWYAQIARSTGWSAWRLGATATFMIAWTIALTLR